MSAVAANRLDRPWSQNHPISPTPLSSLQVSSFTVSNCIGLLFAILSHTFFSGFVHVQSFYQKPFPAFQASFVLRKPVDRQTTWRNKQSDWQARVFPMFYVFFFLCTHQIWGIDLVVFWQLLKSSEAILQHHRLFGKSVHHEAACWAHHSICHSSGTQCNAIQRGWFIRGVSEGDHWQDGCSAEAYTGPLAL